MGHRHMTYIYVYNGKGDEFTGTLWNSWNFEAIQPQKIIRFEKQLAKWAKQKNLHYPMDYSQWVRMYKYIASICDTTFEIEFSDYRWYDQHAGMYAEDCGQGWQFVVIKVDENNKPEKITYGFKPQGTINRQGNFQMHKSFVNLYTNIPYDDINKHEEYKFHTVENYLKRFNKTERAILERVNNSFDVKIIKFAEGRIKKHIDKKRIDKHYILKQALSHI